MTAEATRIKLARNAADSTGSFPIEDLHFEWEPMRLDMIRESANVSIVRTQVAELPCDNHLRIDGIPINVWAGANLSDVRVFDILLWKKDAD
jgi:hypothetical protein